MNKLKLDNIGGLHFYQDALAYMHNAAREAILQISKAVGNNAIVEGCELAGGVISNGIVVIDNEIMPFEGGATMPYIAVSEIAANEEFEDGTPKQVYFTRKAVLAGSGIPLADFKRITPLRDIINAKSDSFTLNDSNTLASSKAVRDLWASIGILGYYAIPDPINFGGGTGSPLTYTVTHNLNLYSSYLILPNIIFLSSDNSGSVYDSPDYPSFSGFKNVGPDSFQFVITRFRGPLLARASFLFLKP